MEYHGGLFIPHCSRQDPNTNIPDSNGFSAPSNILGTINTSYLLRREVSNSVDVSLIRVADYRLINDPILNEETVTSTDDLFAQATQAIPQYEENGFPLASNVEVENPQPPTTSVPLETHRNAVLRAAAAFAQQCSRYDLRTGQHGRYDPMEAPIEDIHSAAIENHLVSSSNLDQISGEIPIQSTGSFPVSDPILWVDRIADGLFAQQFSSFSEDACLDRTEDPQSPFPGTNFVPMNDDFQDQVGMSPDTYYMFPDQTTGGDTGISSEVEDVPAYDQNDLEDHQEIGLLGREAHNDLQTTEDRVEEGVDQGYMDLMMDDEFPTIGLTTKQLSANGENVPFDQTTVSAHTNVESANTNRFDTERAEKLRVIFLYPLYKQMKDYKKRIENSTRVHRRPGRAKYYAMKRMQQDISENLEIAQKAAVVSRQLQLEREQLQRDIEQEKQEVSRLRAILERYAVGRRT